jgi:sodium-coupled neutral amino acid transporter 2
LPFLTHAHAPRSLLSPRHARSRVDSLKFTSALSMCLSFMFISITLCLVVDRLLTGRIGRVNWFPDANASAGDVLKTLPVMMTAYVCHYNVHPIFSEMAAPSERRMRGVVTAALLLCSSVYWLVGLSAYLLFTERTQDDVLMNFGRDLDMARGEAWVEHAVKTGYALSLSCTFPLIQFALRQSVFDLAGWGDAREQPRRFYAVTVRARVPASPTRVRMHRGFCVLR